MYDASAGTSIQSRLESRDRERSVVHCWRTENQRLMSLCFPIVTVPKQCATWFVKCLADVRDWDGKGSCDEVQKFPCCGYGGCEFRSLAKAELISSQVC